MANKYEYVKKSVAKRRKLLDELKTGPCSKCGNKFPPVCMDWHHLDKSKKSFGIARDSFRRSIEQLKEEIKKCILLCANCHRLVEQEEKIDKNKDI